MPEINTDYINNLIARVDTVSTCEDLAEIKDQIEAYFKAQMDDLQKTIDALLVLNITDMDPTKVLAWIQNFISANITGPYNKALILQAELIIELANLTSKINGKISSLKCDL